MGLSHPDQKHLTSADYLEVRKLNDLRTIVETRLGPPVNGKWLCPFHEEKTPSFAITPDKEHYKCFGCGATGDVSDLVAHLDNISVEEAAAELGGYVLDLGLSPEEKAKRQAQVEAKRARKKAEAEANRQDQAKKAAQKVANLVDMVNTYHSFVGQRMDYWLAEGITEEDVKTYKLGYHPGWPSFVIPTFHGDKLVAVRHRLDGRDKDKYRPHFKGMPNQIFLGQFWPGYEHERGQQIDIPFPLLEDGEAILLEGEKKAIVVSSHLQSPVAGLPGLNTWQPEWLRFFEQVSKIYLVLDPGIKPDIEGKQIARIAGDLLGINKQVIQVRLPAKPDDFFVIGGSAQQFLAHLQWGRRIRKV
jgi:hypothetical protein